MIERLFASCNLHPRVVAYSDDFHASLEMAAAGLGAALVPELALLHRPAGVVVLDVPEIRLARNVFALLINEKQTAQVQLFVELLADTIHTLGTTRGTRSARAEPAASRGFRTPACRPSRAGAASALMIRCLALLYGG